MAVTQLEEKDFKKVAIESKKKVFVDCYSKHYNLALIASDSAS